MFDGVSVCVVDGEFVVDAELELDEEYELLAEGVCESAGLVLGLAVPVYDVDGLALCVGLVIVGLDDGDTVDSIDFDAVFVLTIYVAVADCESAAVYDCVLVIVAVISGVFEREPEVVDVLETDGLALTVFVLRGERVCPIVLVWVGDVVDVFDTLCDVDVVAVCVVLFVDDVEPESVTEIEAVFVGLADFVGVFVCVGFDVADAEPIGLIDDFGGGVKVVVIESVCVCLIVLVIVVVPVDVFEFVEVVVADALEVGLIVTNGDFVTVLVIGGVILALIEFVVVWEVLCVLLCTGDFVLVNDVFIVCVC